MPTLINLCQKTDLQRGSFISLQKWLKQQLALRLPYTTELEFRVPVTGTKSCYFGNTKRGFSCLIDDRFWYLVR